MKTAITFIMQDVPALAAVIAPLNVNMAWQGRPQRLKPLPDLSVSREGGFTHGMVHQSAKRSQCQRSWNQIQPNARRPTINFPLPVMPGRNTVNSRVKAASTRK